MKDLRQWIALCLAAVFTLGIGLVIPGQVLAEEEAEEAGDVVEFRIMSSIWGVHEDSLNDEGSNDILDELMKRGNAKITYEWFPGDQYQNRVTTTLATGDIPEVINAAMNVLVDEGAAIPLDDLMEEHGENIMAVWEGNPIEESKLRSIEDGKLYAIPFALNYPPAYAWTIRTDWLENVGIEELPETWEDWLTVWEAFRTQDPNGDGNPDNDIPFSGDIYSLMPLFGMNVSNRQGFYVDEDNQYTIAPESENFEDFLLAMREMYEKGYLDPEFAQRGVYVGQMDLQDALNAGLVGSTFSWAEMSRIVTDTVGDVVEGAKLEGVQPPTGPKGHSGIPARSMLAPTSTLTISAEDKAEQIMDYFNFVFSDEGTRLSSYGIEGVHYDLVDGEPVLKDEYGAGFVEARSAGINFTPLAHHFDSAAYETLMLGGQSYEEAPESTQIFYDALNIGEGKFFSATPILATEQYKKLGTDLLTQLANAMAECVAGIIDVDEFYQRYEEIKDAGLADILEEQNEIWQSMTAE